MAKERPTTQVFAAPVTTFVQPQAAAAELYDQQAVNLALQMSEAFSDLSVTAARVLGQLKAQSNEENVQKGADLVNTSRKTYRQLMEEGQINPAENPWMAVGAQKASGAIEGMRARAQFDLIYQAKAEQDPKFFDSMDGFDALAANFASNYAESVGDSEYLKSAFFESFNPHINEMSSRHVQNMVKKREEKAQIGIAASVAQAVQDFRGGMNIPAEAGNSAAALQRYMDEMVANGYSPDLINNGVVDNLISVASQSDRPEDAEELLQSIMTGPADSPNRPRLADTGYAKAALQASAGKRQQNRERVTNLKNDAFNDWLEGRLDDATNKRVGADTLVKEWEAEAEARNMAWNPGDKNARRAFVRAEYNRRVAEKDKEVEQQRDNAFYGSLDEAITPNSMRELSPESWRQSAKTKINQTIDNLGLSKEQAVQRKMMAERTIDSAVDESVRRNSTKTFEGLFGMAGNLAVTPKPQDFSGTEEQWLTNQRESFKTAVDTSGLPETQKESLRAHFEKKMEDSVAARSAKALQDSWTETNLVNERTYMAQMAAFVDTPRDPNGKPIPGAGGDIPDTEVMRTNLQNFMARYGIDPNSADGRKIYRQTYDRLTAMIDQAFPDSAFAPNENDTKAVADAKADARSRKMALKLQRDASFGEGETTGQMIRQFQRILNTQAAENPTPQDLAQAGDILAAFTYIRDNMTFKQALPSGAVGKAFEEEIGYAMRRRAEGVDIANILADIASRKSIGSTYRMSFMDLQNPLNYMNLEVGNKDDQEKYRADFFALHNELGVPPESDAGPYFAAKFQTKFFEALQTTGNFSKAVNKAKESMREEFFVVRGSLIPRADLPRSVTDETLEVWLTANFPTYPNAQLVVIGETPEGKPMFIVNDGAGNRVRLPSMKPILLIDDIKINDTNLPNFGPAQQKVRASRAAKNNNLTNSGMTLTP